MIAYRFAVSLGNENWVSKSIWRVEVLTLSDKNATVNDYGTKVRVPRAFVKNTLEEAERECEAAANELISKLMLRIKELQQPASYTDRVTKSIMDDDS